MMIVVMCALVAWLAIYSRLPYKPHNKVLTYSKATAYSKNGTLGIKLWVLKKT